MEERRQNSAAGAISTLKSVYPDYQVKILKEDDVNSKEKDDALILSTADSKTILVFDCKKMRNPESFTWIKVAKRNGVMIYLKGRQLTAPYHVDARMLRHVFEELETACQICDRAFVEGEKHRVCTRCGYVYCFKCGVRMLLTKIQESGAKEFLTNCPQCQAKDFVLLGSAVDRENKMLIPPNYYNSISNNGTETSGLTYIYNVMAALLQHIYPKDADAAALIDEILAHRV